MAQANGRPNTAPDTAPADHANAAPDPAERPERAAWMGLLARAAPADLAAAMTAAERALGGFPRHRWLRAPEIGTVMVQARIGGTGQAYNQGEITVTRAALRLPCGTVGHAWVGGRDRDHATRAAMADALLQRAASAPAIRDRVLGPLAARERAVAAETAAKAAATKVNFFTLVRGENA